MSKSATPFPLNELERMFGRMGEGVEGGTNWWELEPFTGRQTRAIGVDLRDDGDALVLIADVPGFEREDIDLRLTDQRLRISAEHDTKEETDEDNYIRRERRHRSLTRTIALPEPVEMDESTATLNQGVLTVMMPKSDPESLGKHIEIS